MPREFPRSRRIEEHIQRVVSDLIRAHVRDPRIHGVVITSVKVTRDLAVAWVQYSLLDGSTPGADLQSGLDNAAGFLRSQLARELTTRTVPELRFRYDAEAERGRELERLIDRAMSRERDHGGNEPG